METRHEISSKQLCTFLIAAQIGIGLLAIPSTLAQKVGHDGWISVILAGMAATIVLVILVLYLKRFKSKSVFEINHILYGKYIGVVINYFIIAYLIFAAVVGIRLFEEVVKMMALKSTPDLILTVFIMLPTIYATFYGLKVIGRFSGLIIFIILVIGVLFFSIWNDAHLSFLQPVGEAGLTKIISGSYDAFFSFVGLELVVVVYPYVKDQPGVMKWSVIGNFTSTVVVLAVTAFTTAFFGEQMIKSLSLPLFNLSRCYKSSIFERIDLFFTMIWFPAMAMSLRAYFFTGYDSICKLIKTKRPTMVLLIYSVVLILLSRVPQNANDTYLLTNILSLCAIAFIVFVIFSYVLSYILK